MEIPVNDPDGLSKRKQQERRQHSRTKVKSRSSYSRRKSRRHSAFRPLVAKDGKVVFSKGYGLADLEWSVPNSPTTRFNIASMTKQFTAASILLLEDLGKLKTDDLVKKYLPDAPTSWDKITIYHLLTHTSGIPDDTAKYAPGPPDKLAFNDSLCAFSRVNNGPTPTWDTSCSVTC